MLPACWSVGRLSVPASLASADERTVAVICYRCGPPHYITADLNDVTEMSSDTEMAPYRFDLQSVSMYIFLFSSAFCLPSSNSTINADKIYKMLD